MDNSFTLIAQPCTREGFEKYLDLYLIWRHGDKVYSVRVRPQFAKDYKLLMGSALHIEPGEIVEKYV